MVDNGQMDVSTIDARVRDVLRVKFELGLFDALPVADPTASDGIVHSEAHAEVAKEAARESLVRFGWLGHRVLVGTQLTRPLFPPHSLCGLWHSMVGAGEERQEHVALRPQENQESAGVRARGGRDEKLHGEVKHTHHHVAVPACFMHLSVVAGGLLRPVRSHPLLFASASVDRYGSFGGDVISILAGIKQVVSTGTSVVYEKGAEYADDAWPESEIVPVDPTSKELKKIAAAGTFLFLFYPLDVLYIMISRLTFLLFVARSGASEERRRDRHRVGRERRHGGREQEPHLSGPARPPERARQGVLFIGPSLNSI
jgi:hypothetical protein